MDAADQAGPSGQAAPTLPVERLLAMAGADLFATAGALWGASHVGWFAAGALEGWFQAGLGIGAALVILGFRRAGWGPRFGATGLGRSAAGFLVAGAALNVLSAAISFAILGTVALGVGLVLLTIAAFRHDLIPAPERWLVALTALASLTWNTETATVWFLVGIGLAWMVLSWRLIPAPARSSTS